MTSRQPQHRHRSRKTRFELSRPLLLAERLAELQALDRLVREVPDQQPAAEPPSLMALSSGEGTLQ